MAKSLLNEEQLKAVRHSKGPLLIVAGAGTGKTMVITERIKFLIQKGLAKPSEILALTFTEKASNEMETRVDEGLPYGYTQMWIMTFHSFCDRVLRNEALQIGLDPKYKLISEVNALQLIRKNLFDFNLNYFRPLGNPNKFISGMLNHFSRLMDEDITPIDYLNWVKKEKKKKNFDKLEIKKWEELAHAYKKYDELKIQNSFLDFGDLIVKTLKLFKDRKNILKEYQERFKYILIDEFQDTNFSQNKLALLLSGSRKNITVVGDDNQSIYRFRGAAVSNILQFKKNFPRAKVVNLIKNYRSTQNILDDSYRLIKFNDPDTLESQLGIDKKLISQRKSSGKRLQFLHANNVEDEADAIIREILKIKSKNKYYYSDFAILVRANNHAEPIIRSLERQGIPHRFLGPAKLFKQPEIIDLISYLKVLDNFEDSSAFFRVASMNIFNINSRDLAALGNFARKMNLSLFEAAEKVDEILVNDETKKKLKGLIEIIKKHLKLIRSETAGQILYSFLQETKLIESLINPQNEIAERQVSNVAKFFDKLKKYETSSTEANVSEVVNWLDLANEIGESPLVNEEDWVGSDAVNILTVHSSKGLEFPVVFLVNLVHLRFPTIERQEQIPIPEKLIKEILPLGDHHLQEERRLFYVGMTRAKDRLYFTAANYYTDGKRPKKLSPFIFEALGDEVFQSEQNLKKVNQLSFLDYKNPGEKRRIINQKLPIHIDFLSYSQIETFKVCPLHYKLRYFLKVPTKPSASLSFGISIHSTLKDFYQMVKSGKKPTEKLLHALLEKNWLKEGFENKTHQKQFFKKGKLYLTGFLKENFNLNNLPILLEENFIIPLQDFKIGGKIDRIDLLGNDQIEIIDYKTGATIPNQKEVDKNLQLSFYALAATEIPYKPFGKKPEEVKLSLYFLDQQQKISTVRTKSDLQKAKEEIIKIKREIEESDFICSKNFLCQNCEYKLLCNTEET